MRLPSYRDTASFHRDELFGLTSQIRRAATSIPSNIAEGCGSGTDGGLCGSLRVAMDSASELEYQILLSRELGLLPQDSYAARSAGVTEVKRMLAPFIKRLKADSLGLTAP
jgi:four helix bundle protein